MHRLARCRQCLQRLIRRPVTSPSIMQIYIISACPACITCITCILVGCIACHRNSGYPSLPISRRLSHRAATWFSAISKRQASYQPWSSLVSILQVGISKPLFPRACNCSFIRDACSPHALLAWMPTLFTWQLVTWFCELLLGFGCMTCIGNSGDLPEACKIR